MKLSSFLSIWIEVLVLTSELLAVLYMNILMLELTHRRKDEDVFMSYRHWWQFDQ